MKHFFDAGVGIYAAAYDNFLAVKKREGIFFERTKSKNTI